MNTEPIALFSNQHHSRERIARVVDTAAGLAVSIELAGDIRRVAAHLSQVEHLVVDDRVLVTDTEYGLVVIGRLRRPTESIPPRHELCNGQLTLEADQSICLRTGKSRLEIHADGRILLDGRHITSRADGPVHFAGATIEFN